MGEVGGNIPCDLHLNRRLKGIFTNLGSNIDPKSIVGAGQTVATVHRVCQVFDSEIIIGKLNHTRHPYPSFHKDLNLVVLNVLHEESVFTPLGERCHNTFKSKFKNGLLQGYDTGEMIKKVKEKY